MRLLVTFLFLFLSLTFVCADFKVSLSTDKHVYLPGEVVTLTTSFEAPEDEVWDTYLFFTDSRMTPTYIIVALNTLEPTPLEMLPKVISLQPEHWRKDEIVRFYLCLCKKDTSEVLGMATAIAKIEGDKSLSMPKLPEAPQLRLLQRMDTENAGASRYTDYKQFDSQWKNELLNQGPKTIGQIGCAMTSAGNIIGWNPSSLNNHLKNNGGYSGNLLIWGKIPNVSYYGSGSISDSLFGSYHVIADVGGHFVLLTGVQSSGNYYSKDPGKSSNPVYSKSQIYGVRLYNK